MEACQAKMLDLMMWTLWCTLGVYGYWFFALAKKLQPLTLDELVILWKLHKQRAGCKVPLSKMEPIVNRRTNEFLGFKCQCGYHYLSKRPIAQKPAREYDMFHSVPAKKLKNRQLSPKINC
jgi:hypothetical protein